MSLNSVQLYVKSVLDGAILPQYDPLTAYVMPPVIENPTAPRAYIWGSTARERRQTGARGSGFKKIRHEVDVWLVVFDQFDAKLDSKFPSTIDAVKAKLRTTPMPIMLTDILTGETSQIIAIGEEMAHDYAPVHATNDQRILRFDARIIVTIEEAIQG